MAKSILYEMYNELKHEYVSKFNVVFNFGDIGRKLYTILEGEVFVLIPKSNYKDIFEKRM